ncbi:DUF2953 domain-containing protein [Paenibacillus sp. GSMTC-2017]|nr:DUF2953 domain-containing protein [Paenibacillus sp. GSMTC-2017]
MMLSHPYGWIMAGGLFFLLIVIIVSASPVVVNGTIRRVGESEDAELNIKALFGLIRYRYKIPYVSFTGRSLKLEEEVSNSDVGINTWKQFNDEIDAEKVTSFIDKVKHIFHITRDLKGWVKGTLSKVSITEWRWNTTVGTGDAMWTAMATGTLWSVKTSIIGLISQMVHVKGQPTMEVNPNFQQSTFATEWSCIAQIRFGYAILAGLQLLVRMKKWKGGVKAWQNTLFKA